ncbi:MAG: VWA domain-containing protein [Rhodocyclaceae bacterium]|nr:VWA domain-containing protein [Rhodocyclaceae bacterium]
MARTRSSGRFGLFAIVALITIGIAVFQNFFEGAPMGEPDSQGAPSHARAMRYDDAVDAVRGMRSQVDWREDIVTERARIELGGSRDLKKSLPDIGTFPLVVVPEGGASAAVAEIFVSTEKSGDGTDGWMVQVAEDFNRAAVRLASGHLAQVSIRKIASGTGHDFIAARKYVPQGFSPSNALWVSMVEAEGVKVEPIAESTVGNVAGVVMKQSVATRLRDKYGRVDVPTLVDAVVQGSLVMGYTDPFASSTGLNFLVTVLSRFSDGKPESMLLPDVVSAFESFQKGVPFVALTTLQMRESVERSGSLDAFVMEYQTYVKTPSLQSGYEFIPFGVRHDNPLVGLGQLTVDQRDTLKAFAEYGRQARYRRLAKEFGFDPEMDYKNAFPVPKGEVLVQAQHLWKEKKDAGRPIAAVFVCDVSGSMRGVRLAQLKKALLGGSEFISQNNSIGLVVFNHQVTTVLPIRPFDLSQKAAFHAAVQRMEADGNTAMYDGAVVGLNMLLDEKARNPSIKPVLFVLTDGDTNRGFNFDNSAPIFEGLGIPIYTIGYEAKIDQLKKLSSLVEAASLNAGEGEIEYKIGALLNAEM